MARRLHRAPAIALVVLGLTAACDPAAQGPGPDEAPGGKADDSSVVACEGWDEPLSLGQVEDERAVGLSGLLVSPRDPAILWAVNDAAANKDRRLFAFDRRGKELETYAVPGTSGQRWRDIAAGNGQLFLLDDEVPAGTARVVALTEPDPEHDDAVADVEIVALTMPAVVTATAMFAIEAESALFVIGRTESGENLLMRAALPLRDGDALQTVLSSLDAAAFDGKIVAADASPDGQHLALKVRDEGVRLWSRVAEQSVADALADDACAAAGAEGKDRAVAIEPGGQGYLLAPDGPQGASAGLVGFRQALTCPDYDAPDKRGKVEADSALEISGLAVSRAHPEVLWGHNDGGDGNDRVVLLAIGHEGEHIGDFALEQADNQDWEDLAIGPADRGGPDVIYIGDIGDNEHARDELTLVRLPEPEVDPTGRGGRSSVLSHEEIVLQYPDGRARNAESLAVDPTTGDVLIISKRSADEPKTEVFIAPAPLTDDEVVVLRSVATQASNGLDARFVAADIAWDGNGLIAQVDGGDSRLWLRHSGEPWASALAWAPCAYDAPDLHIETIALGPDGSYWMIPEGREPPVFEASR